MIASRRALGALALVVGAGVAALVARPRWRESAPVQARWVLTDLGTLAGEGGTSFATGVNDRGQVVGTSTTKDGSVTTRSCGRTAGCAISAPCGAESEPRRRDQRPRADRGLELGDGSGDGSRGALGERDGPLTSAPSAGGTATRRRSTTGARSSA